MKTVFAIGDVQGCINSLKALCSLLKAPRTDIVLIFAGDLVNRGPKSLSTLRFIRSIGDTAITVLGNHDLHLLAVANGICPLGRPDTFREVLDAPDRDELLDWLRHRPFAQMQGDHLVVHAGLLPQWSASDALELAAEVETALRGPHYIDFLRQMYGNGPARWDESLRGPDRLRCIVNALTRVRYCLPDGTMVFDKGENKVSQSPGALPWFDVPGRKTENVTVVFGHWSQMGLVMRPNLIGLDTGCVWGGKLTAVNLQDRSVIQVNCPQYQRPG